MKRFLSICLFALLLVPPSVSASVLCVPSSPDEIRGDAMSVTHPNILGGAGVLAGTFQVSIDCVTPTEVYCIVVGAELCYPAEYQQAPDITSPEVVWILNNYYPAVPGMPSELSTYVKRMAAVQLALWHFTDGIDISTGGSDPEVFAAANAIIALAQTAAVPATPTTLVLSPYTVMPAPGDPVTVTATLYDQNGNIMPDYPIDWIITNDGSGSGMTDSDGQITLNWTESASGNDQAIFTVNYTIPVGLRWTLPGCQDLIQGSSSPGRIIGVWGPELPNPTEQNTWGSLKSLYR